MPKSMDDLGLYNDLPPDATVDGYIEDPGNPGWVEATFSDGRTATLPKDHAESLPQTPSAMPYGPPAGPMGPPLPPEPAPLPEELAAAAPEPPAAPAAPAMQQTFDALGNPTGMEPVPTAPGSAPGDALVTTPGAVGSGSARVNPMAEVVSDGTAGGVMAPSENTFGQSSTTSSTVDDPLVMQSRIESAADEQAAAERMKDMVAYRGRADQLDEELDQRDAQAAELELQQLKAEALVQEHQKFIKAVEDNPIDEDAYWSEKPGREAGAWIALALSGFLQGATKGQNPALNQMVQALNASQDRWLSNQQKNRDGILARREKALGNAENARDSVKMQLAGIVNKKIDLESQRAGLPAPPGLETYKAQGALKAAEAQNQIGARIDQQSTQSAQQQFKASQATGPVRRGDLVLKQLGLDEKAKREAFDPKGADLGGAVKSAQRLDAINTRLKEIQADFGDLPQQNRLSWTGIGAAGVAGRSGSDAAKAQLEATGLLKEAALMLKQSAGTTKFFDSESEREDLQKQIDTGETSTTMAAIARMAAKANESAVNTASQFTRDPQGLIDYTRQVQGGTAGVESGKPITTFKAQKPGQPQGEAGAVSATTGGGPATPPLAAPPAGSATALSQGGTYLRGRFRKPL